MLLFILSALRYSIRSSKFTYFLPLHILVPPSILAPQFGHNASFSIAPRSSISSIYFTTHVLPLLSISIRDIRRYKIRVLFGLACKRLRVVTCAALTAYHQIFAASGHTNIYLSHVIPPRLPSSDIQILYIQHNKQRIFSRLSPHMNKPL